MKKLSLLLLTVIVLCFSGLSAFAQDVEKGFTPQTSTKITAQAILLKSLDTGDVLYEKNADVEYYPASLVKLMTAIVAVENTDNLDTETVTYSQAVQDYLYLYRLEHGAISNAQLVAGEELSMRDMLYAALLPSANEAAMCIAEHVGGSQEDFVAMMNTRAQELGAKSTNFVNATGLFDKNQVTTARDLAVLAEYALENQDLSEITSAYTHTVSTNKHESLTWYTTVEMQNPEHSYYYDGIKGVKTGSLPESGRNYIATVQRDGYNYLLVILGSEIPVDANGNSIYTGNQAFVETRAIFDWVFKSFRTKTLVNQGEVVGEVPVKFSADNDFIQVVTGSYFSYLVPENYTIGDSSSQLTQDVDVPDIIEAPITKGDVLGKMTISLAGEEIGSVDLVAASSVNDSRLLKILDFIKTLSKSFWFKFVVALLVILIILYIVLMIIRNRNRKRKNARRNMKFK